MITSAVLSLFKDVVFPGIFMFREIPFFECEIYSLFLCIGLSDHVLI